MNTALLGQEKGQPFEGWPVNHTYFRRSSGLSDPWEVPCLCLLGAAPGDFRVAARQDGFHAVAAALGGSRVGVAVLAVTHAAAEVRPAGPVEAAYYVPCPDGIAAEFAAGSPVDALAVQALSGEFLAADCSRAVLVELPENDYFPAALVAVPEGDCSPDACPGIAEAAAPA